MVTVSPEYCLTRRAVPFRSLRLLRARISFSSKLALKRKRRGAALRGGWVGATAGDATEGLEGAAAVNGAVAVA